MPTNAQIYENAMDRIDREYRRRIRRINLCYSLVFVLCVVVFICSLYLNRLDPTTMAPRTQKKNPIQRGARDEHTVEGGRSQDKDLVEPSFAKGMEVAPASYPRGTWIPESQVITAVVVQGDRVRRDVVIQRGSVTYSDNMIVGNVTVEVEKGQISRFWGEGRIVVQ